MLPLLLVWDYDEFIANIIGTSCCWQSHWVELFYNWDCIRNEYPVGQFNHQTMEWGLSDSEFDLWWPVAIMYRCIVDAGTLHASRTM